MTNQLLSDSTRSTSCLLGRLDDIELLTALSNDNRLAFAELYERYWYKLYRLAYQKTKSHETAEELVQDLFVQLWQKRKSLEITQVDAYLWRSLKYSIIDHIKHQLVRQRYQAEHLSIGPSFDCSIDADISYQELVGSIETEIVKLPVKTQEIFRLSRFEGFTIPEISTRLDLSNKVVEYHLTKALKLLRLQLQHYICLFIFLLS